MVATKCDGEVVTDESMDLPPEWQRGAPEHDRRGHREEGRTIALHSLAVLPAYQRIGLGRTIMKSYIQRMETAGVADRIALLAHGHLVEYYETFGFVNKGESAARFGGGGWMDMVDSMHVCGFPINHTDPRRSTSSPTLALAVERSTFPIDNVAFDGFDAINTARIRCMTGFILGNPSRILFVHNYMQILTWNPLKLFFYCLA